MNNKYDVIIVGSGVAGIFGAYRLFKKNKNIKVLLIELGHKYAKRRRFLEGWGGSLPFSDGKLYPGDVNKVLEISTKRQVNTAYKFVHDVFSEVDDMKLIKDRAPNAQAQKSMRDNGFEFSLNDYIQWKPESFHKFSKNVAEELENHSNLTFNFDNEVHNIFKQKGNFVIHTENGDFTSKKVILCAGRSGWRWVNKMYKDLGIIVSDDIARIGIRVEMTGQNLKEFNKSHCTIIKDNLEIDRLNWNGTVIPEDHSDLVISSFRSNETRWHSDKVSFSLISSQPSNGSGVLETERLGKLAFLLSNDRVGKERVKTIMREASVISLIPEYKFLIDTIHELSKIMPNIINKGYIHIPNITAMASKVSLTSNLESEIDGLFIAGESSGISGIITAATMGVMAADGIMKK